MPKILLLALFITLSNVVSAANPVVDFKASSLIPIPKAITIQAYCEDYNPYNFEENGVITGFSVDLLRAIGKQAKIELTIELVPWKRYLKVVESTPNTLLFTATRNQIREDRFKWIGPIDGRTQKLYKLKETSSIWHMEMSGNCKPDTNCRLQDWK